MRMLLLLVFISLAAAVSLETQQVNGSLFYKATNNGGIEPVTWLNASSGNAQIGNGQTQETVLQRMSYYDMAVGAVYLNGGHPTWITLANGSLDGWNTYGYSDNLTTGYWRTESNHSFTFGQRTLTVRLKHAQQASDDLISIAIEANASGRINLPDTAWLAVALININYLDSVSVWNATAGYSARIGSNASFENWTTVSITNWAAGWGWRFEQDDFQGSRVIVENDSVYFVWPLSNSLDGDYGRYFRAIDETPCGLSCDVGCGVAIDQDYDDANDAQVTMPNSTISARWRSACFGGGSCTLSPNCYLWCRATSPYDSLGTYKTIATPGVEPYWIGCNMLNASHGCYQSGGNYFTRTPFSPTVNTWYYFQTVNIGRYVKASGIFNHRVQCALNGGTNSVNITVNGTDIKAPYLNGCDFGSGAVLNLTTNNTLFNVYSTNGSLAYVNVTPNCSFGTPFLTLENEAFGIVNRTGMRINQTGMSWNVTAVLNAPWAFQTVQYDNLRNGTLFQLCVAANGTNASTAGGGPKDFNWSTSAPWCYWFKLNIRPLPPSGGLPTPPTYHALGIEEDEYGKKPFPYGILLLAGIIAVGFYVYFKT